MVARFPAERHASAFPRGQVLVADQAVGLVGLPELPEAVVGLVRAVGCPVFRAFPRWG